MSLRHKFCMDNPLTAKKLMSMDFIFDLFILAFFGRGVADMCHSLLSLFVSYSKDPCFVTCNHVLQEISVTLDPFQKMKTHVLPIVLLFDCQVFGNNLRNNFLMANSCVKI